MALTTSQTWKAHTALRYSEEKKSKKSEIPLITKPLHKHTFHITCMKGKIKKSQREKWKGSSSKTSNELKREKHFYANKMTAASFHIFPFEKILSCLMWVVVKKKCTCKKEENTFRGFMWMNTKIFISSFFREAMQQTLFPRVRRKGKVNLFSHGKRE